MAPVSATGPKNKDDIPVAHRSKPDRPAIQWGYKSLLFFSFFIFLFSFFIIRSSLFKSYFFKSSSSITSIESELDDGRLLGHFPYREALPESLVSVYPGFEVHKDTYTFLRAMRAAAEADGVQLILLSGFRSHDLQEEIFFDVKSIRNQTATERARVSAPPGYSEHSTGYAVDFGDAERRDTDFTVAFENTRAFKWLNRNAARYHFVLSYPFGNIQGVSYEPWHWRFEGTAEALREFEAARRFTENK